MYAEIAFRMFHHVFSLFVKDEPNNGKQKSGAPCGTLHEHWTTETLLFSPGSVISRMDAFPYYQSDPEYYASFMRDYFYFQVKGFSKPLGYVHISVVDAIEWPQYWRIDRVARTLTLMQGDSARKRSQLMKETLWAAASTGKVPRLRRWHGEVGPVYASNQEYVLDMDFSATGIFGVVGYAVMLTGWTVQSCQRMYLVPRRSRKKLSHPGMLDNFVSGTLRPNERPVDCMVREIFEETGLEEEYTRPKLVACGTVTYHATRDSEGTPVAQPEVQYVYEIEIESQYEPKPNDDEVESFTLMTAEEVRKALARDEFKPNTGMTWLAHFIRHGFINAENEGNLVEVHARLHRKHDLFIV